MYVAIDADAIQRHTRYQSDIFGAVVVLWVAIKNARMHAYASRVQSDYPDTVPSPCVATTMHSERCIANSNPSALCSQTQSISLNCSL